VHGSDVVVLATPVVPIIDLIERLGPALAASSLLTDVGSTKAEVVARATKVFKKAAGQRFLAGHPMAGKDRRVSSSPMLTCFRGRVFLLPRRAGHLPCRSGEFLEWVERSVRRSPFWMLPNTINCVPGSAICRR